KQKAPNGATRNLRAQKEELVEGSSIAARKNFLRILVMAESRLLLCVPYNPAAWRFARGGIVEGFGAWTGRRRVVPRSSFTRRVLSMSSSASATDFRRPSLVM